MNDREAKLRALLVEVQAFLMAGEPQFPYFAQRIDAALALLDESAPEPPADVAALRDHVREEFELAVSMTRGRLLFDIASAMLNVDALCEAVRAAALRDATERPKVDVEAIVEDVAERWNQAMQGAAQRNDRHRPIPWRVLDESARERDRAAVRVVVSAVLDALEGRKP